MTPIDAVQPPENNQKKNPELIKNQQTKKIVKKKREHIKNSKAPQHTEKKPKDNSAPKVRSMWSLVIITTIVIVVLWVLLFSSGSLTPTDKSTSRFGLLSNKVEELWESIKEDFLQIKDTVEKETQPASPEQIEELEEKVFPQFTDPTRQ